MYGVAAEPSILPDNPFRERGHLGPWTYCWELIWINMLLTWVPTDDLQLQLLVTLWPQSVCMHLYEESKCPLKEMFASKKSVWIEGEREWQWLFGLKETSLIGHVCRQLINSTVKFTDILYSPAAIDLLVVTSVQTNSLPCQHRRYCSDLRDDPKSQKTAESSSFAEMFNPCDTCKMEVLRKYSRTSPCGHPTTVDTPPLWTLFSRPVWFSLYNPVYVATPSFTNVDTSLLWTLFVRPLTVHISEVLLYIGMVHDKHTWVLQKWGQISKVIVLGPLKRNNHKTLIDIWELTFIACSQKACL